MNRIALPKGYKVGGILAGKDIQTALKHIGFYTGVVDDHLGPGSIKAAEAFVTASKYGKPTNWQNLWDSARLFVAVGQMLCLGAGIDAGNVDGLVGPQTRYAFDLYLTTKVNGQPAEFPRDTPVVKDTPAVVSPLVKNVWPLEKDLLKVYGPMGQNQTKVEVPWPMFLAWDTSARVRTITVHEKVAPSVERVLTKVNNHYSYEQLKAMGVHLFGGSLNVRLMRGSKTRWSTHSWGIAIDFDPERNQLTWGRDRARLAKQDAEAFWKFWEEEGWVSLGRAQDRDWMHVQASRLK